MKASCWLTFTKKGVVSMNKQRVPSLSPGEFCVKINLEVPDAYFAQAIPQVNLKVSENSLMKAPIEATTEPVDQ